MVIVLGWYGPRAILLGPIVITFCTKVNYPRYGVRLFDGGELLFPIPILLLTLSILKKILFCLLIKSLHPFPFPFPVNFSVPQPRLPPFQRQAQLDIHEAFILNTEPSTTWE